MATNRVSAKKLLLDDGDYSTTQDHYFSYINRRQGAVVDKSLDNKIIEELKTDNYMPDLMKNKVENIGCCILFGTCDSLLSSCRKLLMP